MDSYCAYIKKEILVLTDDKKLFFALLCCERLFFNYTAFSKKYNWGTPSKLRDGIDYLLKYFENKQFDKIEIERLMKEIYEITPDTENFSTILASFALRACGSIHESLSFLLDPDITKIVDVASFARDTVDMFIQEKENLEYDDPSFELKIANDSFMVKEKERQSNHLELLFNNELNHELKTKLREDNLKDRLIDLNLIK
jgi:uncharacterized protein